MRCPQCNGQTWTRLGVVDRETTRNADPLYRICLCGHIYQIGRREATEAHCIERDIFLFGRPRRTTKGECNG